MSNIIRAAKNKIKNFTPAEVLVREATSNDPWGPSSSLMHEISSITHKSTLQREQIMEMILRRTNDHGKNWRHVYKSLILLEYICLTGNAQIYEFCKSNIHLIETLTNFQHYDKDGRDLGINIREKARRFANLLVDHEQFLVEQDRAKKTTAKTHDKVYATHDDSMVSYDNRFPGPRLNEGTDFSFSNAVGMRKGISQDLKQAMPRTADEEDAQLRLALAMSKEELEKDSMRRMAYSNMEQMVIQKSKQDSQEDINVWKPQPMRTERNEDIKNSFSLVDQKSSEMNDSMFSAPNSDPFAAPPSSSRSRQTQSTSHNLILEDIFSTPQTSQPIFGDSVKGFDTACMFADNVAPLAAPQESPGTQFQQTSPDNSSAILKQFLGDNSSFVDVSLDSLSRNQKNPFSSSNPFAPQQGKKVTLNELKSTTNTPTSQPPYGQPGPTNFDNFFL